MGKGLSRDHMKQAITRYFEGCNEANVEKMLEYLSPEAVHYFPAGAPQGPFIGAEAIAAGWKDAVARLGSIWTVDHMIFDESAGEAVIEWTHYKPKVETYLRGDEWYRFNDKGLITEIRAYYACPPLQGKSHELGGFDYAGRGYPVRAPEIVRTS
jgi:hypothetical protein